MMKLIDLDALKKLVEQRFDMQDCYLPIHFLEVAEELSEKGDPRWIPFKKRPLTDEEKKLHPDWAYILENTPDDGQEILISNKNSIWLDMYMENGDECYLDSGYDIENGTVWMPLPEPYKGE